MTDPSEPHCMTNRIADRLHACADSGRIGIMPFLTAGYPTPESTGELIVACDQAGAAAIEVGFPFSDPIADGPVISASMQCALDAGVTPAAVTRAVREVRGQVRAGLIAMVSQSIVHRQGGPDFLNMLYEHGFDGVIIPDLDLEDAAGLRGRAEELDLAFALLVAPTTAPERTKRIVESCLGFIYLLARTGLTGEQAAPPDLRPRVEQLRQWTDLPIAAGFGISTPEHIRTIAPCVDAAIVGSALVRRLGDASNPAKAAQEFVQALVEASARDASER